MCPRCECKQGNTLMDHRWRKGQAPAVSAMLAIGLALANPVRAEQAATSGPLAIEAEAVLDVVGVPQGVASGARHVEFFSLSADLSLDQAIGWQGARVFLHGIASTGGRPNDLAGTLQGVNNIEVAANRARLFEAYLEQDLPAIRGSLRLGFSDLNAEFYANDAAGLLLAPAFGIGSELSATGSNGPAIFPSTAPMLRLKLEPGRGTYLQFAAINAEAGVPGDPGGVRPLLNNGALLIGEVGIAGKGKFALGAWSYTRRQDDIRLTTPSGDPASARARGIYLLGEQPIVSDKLTAFLRVGLSDGDTTPYVGGWQAGVLAERVFAGRPDSQFSLGVNQAYLSHKYRANAADAGDELRAVETAIEVTYADKLAPWLTVQPDLQYVWTPSRTASSSRSVVVSLRLRIDPSALLAH